MLASIFTTPIVPAAFAGVAWGILGGALPGISPSITMALLLPFTYGMDPTVAIVLLASTYVGAEYGGSIPAILIRTPGTNAAAATVIDGYAMKQQGKAGEALGISLYSGFVGGLFGLVVLVLLTEPLSTVALAFTPTSYFALGVLGLSVIASLSGESLVKGLMAGVLGPDDCDRRHRPGDRAQPLHVRQPGAAVRHSADPRDGRACSRSASCWSQSGEPGWEKASTHRARGSGFRGRRCGGASRCRRRSDRSSGTFEGIMPGGGGTISAFLAYNEARRWSRHKEEFGKGSPGGHCRAGSRQQHRRVHGARADAEPRHSELELRRRCCSAAS